MLRIERVAITDAAAQALIEEVQEEYVRRYGGRDESPVEAAAFEDPVGAFFVGYLGDVPLAMGGWRRRPDVRRLDARDPAEIKRMYVAPAGRRSGLARRMLAHIEVTALADGIDVLVLETGTEQPEAIALYVSSGYARVESFGHYAWSPKNRCFGKTLEPPAGITDRVGGSSLATGG